MYRRASPSPVPSIPPRNNSPLPLSLLARAIIRTRDEERGEKSTGIRDELRFRSIIRRRIMEMSMRAMTIPTSSAGERRGGEEAHMDRFNANSADCAFTIREFITICGFVSRLSSAFYFFPFLLLFFSSTFQRSDILIFEYKYSGRCL